MVINSHYVLFCLATPQRKPDQCRMALSSPHEVAIKGFLGCLGQLAPIHWRWLLMNHAHWGLSLRFPTLSATLALSLPCLLRL